MRVIIFSFFLALSITSAKADAVNLLTNGDFSSFGGWIAVEQGVFGQNVFIADNGIFPGPPADAIHGATSLKMFGNFSGGFNQGIVLQNNVPAAPGEVFDACLEFYTSNGDPISGASVAFFRIAFFDAAGNEIAGQNSAMCDATMVQDVWQTKCVNGFVAPAGTVTAGYFIFFQQIDGVAGGSMFYDNATFCRQGDIPPPSAVPTLGQWGLFSLSLIFLGLGTGLFYSRKLAVS